jgi:hypothetical protein
MIQGGVDASHGTSESNGEDVQRQGEFTLRGKSITGSERLDMSFMNIWLYGFTSIEVVLCELLQDPPWGPQCL